MICNIDADEQNVLFLDIDKINQIFAQLIIPPEGSGLLHFWGFFILKKSFSIGCRKLLPHYRQTPPLRSRSVFERTFSLHILRVLVVFVPLKYSLQGTTQGNGLTGGLPPVRFSM